MEKEFQIVNGIAIDALSTITTAASGQWCIVLSMSRSRVKSTYMPTWHNGIIVVTVSTSMHSSLISSPLTEGAASD